MQQALVRILAGTMMAGATFGTAMTAGAQSYNANSTYANPDGTTTSVWQRRGPCTDPWVSIALVRVFGAAHSEKCNVSQYNGGRWNSFNDLVHAVARRWTPSLPTVDLKSVTYKTVSETQVELTSSATGAKVGTLTDGTLALDAAVKAQLVAAGGGNLVGNDGASLVAAGGGNLIGNDGSTLVAAGGGNLVPPFEVKLGSATLVQSGGASNYKLQGVRSYSALKAATRRRR